MPKPKGRPRKDKYECLSEDFKSAIQGGDESFIKQTIQDASLYFEALMAAKKEDEALKEAQTAAKEAGDVYRDGTKVFRAKIAYCREIRSNRGYKNPEVA